MRVTLQNLHAMMRDRCSLISLLPCLLLRLLSATTPVATWLGSLIAARASPRTLVRLAAGHLLVELATVGLAGRGCVRGGRLRWANRRLIVIGRATAVAGAT